MALINLATRRIDCKVVYYGPSMSGKTANLHFIRQRLPDLPHATAHTLGDAGQPTLLFDYLPLDMGVVDGYSTRFHLYTVPGKTDYSRSRGALLTGVDGVVFVADAQRDHLLANLESQDELQHTLAQCTHALHAVPIVLQYTKRDAASALAVEDLQQRLNPHGRPFLLANAQVGQGVLETLRAISQLVLNKL